MIKIYYGSPSIFGRKVLTVLEEKNLDYEIHWVDLRNGEHQKPEYLQLNPNGEVPVIEDDGTVIYESTAIIEYLDEEYPEPSLMPKTSQMRAQVRMIEDYCDLHLYALIRQCARKLILQQEKPTEDERGLMTRCLSRISQYLGGKSYLVGNAFTLADCAWMPVIPSLEFLGMSDLLVSAPGLKAYSEQLKKRAGFKGACLTKPLS